MSRDLRSYFYGRQEKMKLEEILGTKINLATREEAERAISEKLRGSISTKIFTPNTEIIFKCHKDSSLRETVNSADLLFPDGSGVIFASKMLKLGYTERITGIDLGEYILSEADKNKLRVFLLGGKDGVANKAIEKLSERFPNTVFCGSNHGYFQKEGYENQKVLELINKTSPDIIFVCFGFPLQEKWINDNLSDLPSVRMAVGLGGSLDVWSQKVKRAPKLMQRLFLEWLWRMILQPRRIVFLTVIPRFLSAVFIERVTIEKKKKKRLSNEQSP